MKYFHVCNYSSYLVITLWRWWAVLAISLEQSIIFAKFFETRLNSNVASLLTHVRWQKKNHSELIWVYIYWFFICNVTKMFVEIYYRNSTCLGFRRLTKSIEIIKLDNKWKWKWKSNIQILWQKVVICHSFCHKLEIWKLMVILVGVKSHIFSHRNWQLYLPCVSWWKLEKKGLLIGSTIA